MRHIKRIGIYRMISPTGKVYIGQSWDITNRKSRYKTLTCKNQRKLYNSLKKYGFEVHNFTVIKFFEDDITQEFLNGRENYYINLYKELGHEVLNLKEGGSHGKHSSESKLKNSLAHKGKIPWNKGKKGMQIAWNKDNHSPRKMYKFKIADTIIAVPNLKKFCSINNLSYCAMVNLANAKHHYKNKPYRGYERI